MSSRAAQTARLLELVTRLPSDEYGRVLSAYLSIVDERAELLPVFWSGFLGLLAQWLRWEEECRGREGACDVEVPEEALESGVATYYSTSLKQLLVTASEELAVDWMLPHWLLWFSARAGRPLAPRLRRLSVEEQLARLVLFPVYARGLRGIARAAAEHYAYTTSEYAQATALFVYWDVVATLVDAVESAVAPIRRLVGDVLDAVEARAYGGARLALAGSKRARPLGGGALEAVGELKKRLGRALVERRIVLEDAG